ncbi:MAG: CehA/McbA family metallohydrolase [Roseiflexaceae bacterium]|nr:CehA/McbA family metallohydrolase [Roseiflexaceae bacterium]
MDHQTYYYPGALHMHTLFSDGTGTVAELAHAAREAGLRWLIITDHDTLAGLPQRGWIDDVLVIIGHEITPERNHFLALNVAEVVDPTQPPQAFMDTVYARGGFGIIAHPDEQVKNDFKDIYRWDDWAIDGPSDRGDRVVGIELWNLMSDWAEQLTQRNKEFLFFFPRQGLTNPTAATLAWWDALNMQGKRTFGVGGVDAHAFKRQVPWGEAHIFPYRWCFETLTNYLVLDRPFDSDPETATHQVYAALAGGRSYFINRLDGTCPNLIFHAEQGTTRYIPGDAPSLHDGPLRLVADTGIDAEVQLIHDGKVLTKSIRQLRQTINEPGIYRLEAYRKGRAWLYTNPLYVTR